MAINELNPGPDLHADWHCKPLPIPDFKSRGYFLGVSTKWSKIVHDTPVLWTWFTTTMFGPLCSDEYVRMAQKNAKEAPLYIEYTSPRLDEKRPGSSKIITEVAPSCQSLYSRDIQIDHPFFRHHYPHVQSLTVTAAPNVLPYPYRAGYPMPSLETLKISGVLPDSLQLIPWKLRHLEMTSACMSWGWLIALFNASARLRTLRMIKAEIRPYGYGRSTSDPPIGLPQLGHLVISLLGSENVLLCTLLRLIAPTASALTTLSIENLDSLLQSGYTIPEWVTEASTRLHGDPSY
jgi:hypothetical protein